MDTIDRRYSLLSLLQLGQIQQERFSSSTRHLAKSLFRFLETHWVVQGFPACQLSAINISGGSLIKEWRFDLYNWLSKKLIPADRDLSFILILMKLCECSCNILDVLRSKKGLLNHLYDICPLKIIVLNNLEDIYNYVIEQHCLMKI